MSATDLWIIDGEEFIESVVGHRIVSVTEVPEADYDDHFRGSQTETPVRITLDNGVYLTLVGYGDCCAGAGVNGWLLAPDSVEHMITNVVAVENDEGKGNGRMEVFILADMEQILRLDTGWSDGTGCYSYGIRLFVERPALTVAS